MICRVSIKHRPNPSGWDFKHCRTSTVTLLIRLRHARRLSVVAVTMSPDINCYLVLRLGVNVSSQQQWLTAVVIFSAGCLTVSIVSEVFSCYCCHQFPWHWHVSSHYRSDSRCFCMYWNKQLNSVHLYQSACLLAIELFRRCILLKCLPTKNLHWHQFATSTDTTTTTSQPF